MTHKCGVLNKGKKSAFQTNIYGIEVKEKEKTEMLMEKMVKMPTTDVL